MRDVVEFFAVAREENGAGAGTVADADYVALDVGGTVGSGGEGLVVPAGAGGGVGEGGAVPACEMLEGSFRGAGREKEKCTWKAEEGVWFCGNADADEGGVGLVVDFGFPIVDFVLFGDGEVALHAAFGVEEFDLRAAFDEAVGDFEFGLEFPGRHSFFLDGEELGE